MCQYDCFHMCMNTPICDSFYNGTLNVCVPVSAFRCLHVCVCARAKVCFCSSVSAQYPSAAKPSINLSTPQPTVSPFLFPLAFLPSFPFISHLTLSLTKPPPPYPTSSLSPTHSPILGITVPCCRHWTKSMHVCWVCFSRIKERMALSFLLLSVLWTFHDLRVKHLSISLCNFNLRKEKLFTVTGSPPPPCLTHKHTCTSRPFHPAEAVSSTPGGIHWKKLAEVSVIAVPLINAHLLLWLLSLTPFPSPRCTKLQPDMHHS